MKKRALIALALLLTALAVLGTQRYKMAACDIKYEIITPDGWSLDFNGPAFAAGTADSLMAHEGFGLPPVEHVTQEIYQMPGALMLDTIVKPRVVTITTTTHGLTPKAMHAARAKLMEAMRWNRGATAEPSILRYTINGISRDLYVHYAGNVRRSVGRYGQMEIIGFRLVAYDPMFYDPETQDEVLDWEDSFTSLYILAKVAGLWNPLGPPAAVGGAPTVSTIAVDPATGYIYIGGTFTNWDNLGSPAGDYVAMWDGAAWNSVGGGLNGTVHVLTIGPDGVVYAGGIFTNGSGGAGDPAADYIAQLDEGTGTWINVGGGPGAGTVTVVYDIVIGHDATLFVIGNFTNWDGLGSPAGDHIVQLPLPYPGGAWATVGNGLNLSGSCGVIAANGNLIAGGQFGMAGGVVVMSIAEWDGAVWAPLGTGTNGTVLDVIYGSDGTLFAIGTFTQAGGNTDCNFIGSWNGASWSDLDTGLGAQAWEMAMGDDGMLYVVGAFTEAGSKPLTLADKGARWNGFSWAHLPFDLPGAPSIRSVATYGDDLYFGWDNTGTVLVAADNTVITLGNVETYPVIEIKNAGLLQTVKNETTGDELLFDLQLLDGEIVTIDLSPGLKTIESNWRGNRLGDLLPDSDLGIFSIESNPRAQYGAVEGANLISVFITDADPRESGDNNNQLSGWDGITGIAQGNTDYGWLYAHIVDDGGGFFHVELSRDAALTQRVGQTASYNGAGAQAIAEVNNSGLGGSITIDAVVAADADIEVIFTIATIFWRDRWLDADNAVS